MSLTQQYSLQLCSLNDLTFLSQRQTVLRLVIIDPLFLQTAVPYIKFILCFQLVFVFWLFVFQWLYFVSAADVSTINDVLLFDSHWQIDPLSNIGSDCDIKGALSCFHCVWVVLIARFLLQYFGSCVESGVGSTWILLVGVIWVVRVGLLDGVYGYGWGLWTDGILTVVGVYGAIAWSYGLVLTRVVWGCQGHVLEAMNSKFWLNRRFSVLLSTTRVGRGVRCLI